MANLRGNKMKSKDYSRLKDIKGIRQAKPEDVSKFKDHMSHTVIPEIDDIVEKRRLAAGKSRDKQLKC